jgi:hypothetical protein
LAPERFERAASAIALNDGDATDARDRPQSNRLGFALALFRAVPGRLGTTHEELRRGHGEVIAAEFAGPAGVSLASLTSCLVVEHLVAPWFAESPVDGSGREQRAAMGARPFGHAPPRGSERAIGSLASPAASGYRGFRLGFLVVALFADALEVLVRVVVASDHVIDLDTGTYFADAADRVTS